MIANLIALRQAFLRFMAARALLGMIILSTLIVLTFLAGVFLMLLTWHWHPTTIFWACSAPWILAAIIIGIVTEYYNQKVKKHKAALLNLSKNHLITNVIGIALSFITKKRP